MCGLRRLPPGIAFDADKSINIILCNADKVTGNLEQMLFEIPYSAHPSDMVDAVSIDLAELPVGSTITVGDLPARQQDTISLQIDADSVILRIRDKKRLSSQPAE